MNRRDFGKSALAIAAAAIVAPKVLAETPDHPYTMLDGKLTVFENPREGYDYSIGIETGNGIDTPSVFSVMRMWKGDEPCVQVAEYISCDNKVDFSSTILWASRAYHGTDPRGPLLVIEQVRAPGDAVQNMLKIMGLTRFMLMKRRNSSVVRQGWYTNAVTGPIITGRFNEAVRDGWIQPKSKELKQSIGKQHKELLHNPYFMAAAQSYVGCAWKNPSDCGKLKTFSVCASRG